MPLVIFIIGPVFLFILIQRFPTRLDRAKERSSIFLTNFTILLPAVLISLLAGFKTYIILQVSVMALAATVGVWLFYVQHQYEGVYWQRHDKWDYALAAVTGSSYYKLPRLLQWFTGSIGFHHIHHLSPRIPNYNLEACYKANPALQVKPLTLRDSLNCLRYRLWDEDNQRLISFREYRELPVPANA
jgi:omega-6 fatty acid desaturase (delta-12 desaturase)